MRRLARLASILLALAQLLPLPAAATDPATWEAWYSLSAHVRGARVDADVEAGGSLSMTGSRDPSGALRLSLQDVREPPWKLYWVNPAGPFGEELKVASVVALREASWEALETAHRANSARGRAHHQRWAEQAERVERPRKLDGTFAFIVIGPARDRFKFEVSPHGMVSKVSNQMTHQWLSGPFDQFIGTWNEKRGAGGRNGYWFWNQGEKEPFDYEPHTYHAFASALELLALPLPHALEDGAAGLAWEDVGGKATRVLETLAPRVDTRAYGAELHSIANPLATREWRADGSLRLTLTSPLQPGSRIERESVFSSEGLPLGDRVLVELTSKRGGLRLEVGYRAEPSGGTE